MGASDLTLLAIRDGNIIGVLTTHMELTSPHAVARPATVMARGGHDGSVDGNLDGQPSSKRQRGSDECTPPMTHPSNSEPYNVASADDHVPAVRYNVGLVAGDAMHSGAGVLLLGAHAEIACASGAAQLYLESVLAAVPRYEALHFGRATERAQYMTTQAMTAAPHHVRAMAARQAPSSAGATEATPDAAAPDAAAPDEASDVAIERAADRAAFASTVVLVMRARVADPTLSPLHVAARDGAPPQLHTTASHFQAAQSAFATWHADHMTLMRAHVSVETERALKQLANVQVTFTARPDELDSVLLQLSVLGASTTADDNVHARGRRSHSRTLSLMHLAPPHANDPLLVDLRRAATAMRRGLQELLLRDAHEHAAQSAVGRKRVARVARMPMDLRVLQSTARLDPAGTILVAIIGRWFRAATFSQSPAGRTLEAAVAAADVARKKEARQRAAAARKAAREAAREAETKPEAAVCAEADAVAALAAQTLTLTTTLTTTQDVHVVAVEASGGGKCYVSSASATSQVALPSTEAAVSSATLTASSAPSPPPSLPQSPVRMLDGSPSPRQLARGNESLSETGADLHAMAAAPPRAALPRAVALHAVPSRADVPALPPLPEPPLLPQCAHSSPSAASSGHGKSSAATKAYASLPAMSMDSAAVLGIVDTENCWSAMLVHVY